MTRVRQLLWDDENHWQQFLAVFEDPSQTPLGLCGMHVIHSREQKLAVYQAAYMLPDFGTREDETSEWRHQHAEKLRAEVLALAPETVELEHDWLIEHSLWYHEETFPDDYKWHTCQPICLVRWGAYAPVVTNVLHEPAQFSSPPIRWIA